MLLAVSDLYFSEMRCPNVKSTMLCKWYATSTVFMLRLRAVVACKFPLHLGLRLLDHCWSSGQEDAGAVLSPMTEEAADL